MKIAPKPSNEISRLEALRRYNIMDTLPESDLDDLTKLAAHICEVPIALISLVDENRQWFKSKIGLKTAETSRDIAFCSHAIADPDHILEVTNALEDDRFNDNPLVTEDATHFRFYAGSPLKDKDGNALGTLCVLDTKPRKMTQNQLESLEILSRQVMSQFELRLKVKEQEEINRENKSLLVERERFLSNISHELRTPLNAIVSAVNLLKDEVEDQHIHEYVDILKFSSENLMALVNDILDINKIESSKIKLEKSPVKIKELVRSIQSAHGLRAEEKGIGLHVYIEEKVPDVVIGDSVRIAQVLNNLIGNAVKFTSNGKVIIEVENKGEEKGSAKILFRVKDTGVGMNKEQQSQLFQRFNQGDKSITRQYGGSGLGLFITKGLLKLMKSTVSVLSEPGVGSSFSFELKLPLYTEKDQQKRVAEFEFGKLKGLVLLVDDNQLNLVLASKFLEKWGIEVEHASNGLEAISKAKERLYDLILMDLQMPIMDGYTATKEIRNIQSGAYKHTPIIAITASVMMEVKDKIHEYGMQDFISKPFTPKGLWEQVSKYLAPKQNRMTDSQPADLTEERKQQLKETIDEYTGGDMEFSTELVDSFILNFEDIRKEAILALQQRDSDLYDDVIHKIKPSSMMLKYDEEYARLISVQDSIHNQDQSANIQIVSDICDSILSDLQTFKNTLG